MNETIGNENDHTHFRLVLHGESLVLPFLCRSGFVTEGEIKVDVEEDPKNKSQGKIMTRLEETAKVKELEKIIVDTKEVDNINDNIELVKVNEYTYIKVKDEVMIITD